MSEPIQVNMYRDWQGLNMGNSWWKDHKVSTMTNVEEICPDLHLLDITTDPTISSVFSEDAGIDGSRFQYNTLVKTPINLKFGLNFSDHLDFLDKKHDIQQYFSSKAGFIMNTSYHPTIHACAYPAGFEGMDQPQGDHYCIFTVKLYNGLGMWYTNNTRWLEDNWSQSVMQDLRVPTGLERPSWKLNPGHNKIWISGDVMSQLTNPIMDCKIWCYGVSGEILSIENETSNTKLVADHKKYWTEPALNGDYVWMNLNFGKVNSVDDKNGAIDYTPMNGMSSSVDFWLDPGWNDIILTGASSAYLDTRFYFANF